MLFLFKPAVHLTRDNLALSPGKVQVLSQDLKETLTTPAEDGAEVYIEDAGGSVGTNALRVHLVADGLVDGDRSIDLASRVVGDSALDRALVMQMLGPLLSYSVEVYFLTYRISSILAVICLSVVVEAHTWV